jgi:hypothetical protein
MTDDDLTSSNNWSSQIGIEIETTTKVSVRNVCIFDSSRCIHE